MSTCEQLQREGICKFGKHPRFCESALMKSHGDDNEGREMNYWTQWQDCPYKTEAFIESQRRMFAAGARARAEADVVCEKLDGALPEMAREIREKGRRVEKEKVER